MSPVAEPRRPDAATGRRGHRALQTSLTAVLVALLMSGLGQMGPAWAFWTATTVVPGSGAAAPLTSVERANTPTPTVNNKNVVPVSWTASTLANGTPVSGYTVQRFNTADTPQTVLAGCTGTLTTTSCTENGVPDGLWRYAVTPRFATNWSGPQSAQSVQVRTDATAPTTTITRTATSGGSFLSGSTLFYRGVAAGGFTLSSAVADAGSGPASATTALGGTTTGWTHTGSTVSTPSGGPYVSNAFSWAAGTTSAPTITVTGRDAYANSSATTRTATNDSTGPTGGAISHTSGPLTTTNLIINLASVTDSGSGLASRLLQESTATLNGDTCGTFGAFSTIATIVTANAVNRTVNNGTCYRYQYVLTDNVGNVTTVAGPTPVEIRNYGNIVAATTGLQSHWRLGQAAGSTTAPATPTANTATCVNGVTFGAAGAIVGDPDTATTFDGVNDYCQVTRSISTTFSIEFWFKSTQGLGGAGTQWYDGAGLVDAEAAGVGNDFGVSLMSDGRVQAGTGGTSDISLASGTGFNNGAWHHVVFTRNGPTGALQLYVNGTLRASRTGGTNALTSTTNIRFGSLQTNMNFYAGQLDEVAFYTTVMPAATVANHYQSGIA